MSRWLAGVFDPAGRVDTSRLVRALAPHAANALDCGALRVAFSGPPAPPGGVLCLFDGHLDNAAELRAALADRAAPLTNRTAPPATEAPLTNPAAPPATEAPLTDPAEPPATEALLAEGYRRWGRGLLERLRGDFALLIWDHARDEGLLARDQLGVRPLFLHDAAGGGPLLFAGEVRHLLALLPRRPPPDAVSVAHWVAASTRPGTSTLYSGIRRLAPARALLFERGSAREWRWWEPRFREPLTLSEEELAADTRAGLESAVRRHMTPGGATGVLMSGGLDSSSVAAICAQIAPDEALVCSATFPEHPVADESQLIDELAHRFALPRIDAEVRGGGVLASALESLAAWEMPLLGWGDFWALPLLRAARGAGAAIVLDGDGGDELFGPRGDLLADGLRSGRPRAAFAVTQRLPGAAANPSRRAVASMFASLAVGALPYPLHRHLSQRSTAREAPRWLRPQCAHDLVESDDPLAWRRLDGPRWWARTAHAITCGIEEAGVFEHQRRRAALAAIEARHPLLDLDLVELSLRQPPTATLDPRFNRPVLRASMAGLLPDSVRLRPDKARFESLVADTLAGPDGGAVRALLCDPRAELGAYVELDGVRRALLEQAPTGAVETFRWMWQVWRLATAECWLRSQGRPGADLVAVEAATSRPRVAVTQPTSSYVFPP